MKRCSKVKLDSGNPLCLSIPLSLFGPGKCILKEELNMPNPRFPGRHWRYGSISQWCKMSFLHSCSVTVQGEMSLCIYSHLYHWHLWPVAWRHKPERMKEWHMSLSSQSARVQSEEVPGEPALEGTTGSLESRGWLCSAICYSPTSQTPRMP